MLQKSPDHSALQRSQEFAGLYMNTRIFSGFYRNTQVLTGIYRFSQVFTGFTGFCRYQSTGFSRFQGLHRNLQGSAGIRKTAIGRSTNQSGSHESQIQKSLNNATSTDKL